MPVADQLIIHRALTQFCEQRARIEILGRQITDNVVKITHLHRQSDLVSEQWGQNVISLDAARTHLDLAQLFSDTARLAKLANQLHNDFSEAANDYLRESHRRRATLVQGRTCSEVRHSPDLLARVDAAIVQCDSEITQIHGLTELSGSTVALLVGAAQQVMGLHG